MYYPNLEDVKHLTDKGNIVPIFREITADLETPVSVFLKINRDGLSFLLESVEGGQRIARYSFLGTEPYSLCKTDTDDKIDPLLKISEELNKYKIVPINDLPRFCGGAVGYISYETVARFEDLPSPHANPINLPEALFMFFNSMLVFDHIAHTIKVLSLVSLEGDIDNNYREAVKKIETLIDRIKQPLPANQEKRGKTVIKDKLIESSFLREEFESSVNKIREYITAGEAIQVVLSRRLIRSTNLAPFDIYRSLRSINPSPYMFFLDFKDFHIIGASPEILVRVEDGTVMTRPLAGTRPRGKTVFEDAELERELRSDEKERAEHTMLVDLGRNDIGRVAEPGTVTVNDLMEVERYSHVMHLVTHVQGKLRKDKNAFDALRACFPAGTVSGAPKIRAMQIIAELEPEKRGPYAGAIGYFSYSGNMDMAIAIRTIVMTGGKAYIQGGCGIVYDSLPEREYEETQNKMKALLVAIDQAENS